LLKFDQRIEDFGVEFKLKTYSSYSLAANFGPYGGRLSDNMAANFSAVFGPYGGRLSDNMAADFSANFGPFGGPIFGPFGCKCLIQKSFDELF